MTGRGVKYCPAPGFHILRIARQKPLVDVALDVHRQAEPRLAVDQPDQTFQLGGVLDLVLRLQEDRPDDPALFSTAFSSSLP